MKSITARTFDMAARAAIGDFSMTIVDRDFYENYEIDTIRISCTEHGHVRLSFEADFEMIVQTTLDVEYDGFISVIQATDNLPVYTVITEEPKHRVQISVDDQGTVVYQVVPRV